MYENDGKLEKGGRWERSSSEARVSDSMWEFLSRWTVSLPWESRAAAAVLG